MEELVGRGHEVSVFARGQTRSRFSEDVRLIKGDRHNPDDLSKLRSHGFEAVIDINAYTREETQAAINTFDGRLSRFVHLSTASVYQITDRMPLVESDPLVTDPGSTYSYNKAECERALRWAYTKNGFPFVTVRPGVVFGPRDNKSRENYYLKRMIAGDPVIVADSGSLPIFAVYVKDLAVSLANALTATGAEGNAYHIMQSELVPINAHIANIARLAGTDVAVTEIPSRLLERVGFNVHQIPYYIGGRLVICDTRAARDDLAFSPTPYLRALKDTITYFLEHDPENHPTIEDRFPPVLPRSRERALTEKYRAAIRALEDNLTDDWLDEAITGLSQQ